MRCICSRTWRCFRIARACSISRPLHHPLLLFLLPPPPPRCLPPPCRRSAVLSPPTRRPRRSRRRLRNLSRRRLRKHQRLRKQGPRLRWSPSRRGRRRRQRQRRRQGRRRLRRLRPRPPRRQLRWTSSARQLSLSLLPPLISVCIRTSAGSAAVVATVWVMPFRGGLACMAHISKIYYSCLVLTIQMFIFHSFSFLFVSNDPKYVIQYAITTLWCSSAEKTTRRDHMTVHLLFIYLATESQR
jgi:hypothetical protein